MLRDRADEFRHSYGDEYITRYGHWRPEISTEFEKYLKCGIPKFGFARVKCTDPECGESFLLAFSCKASLCPSCLQKNMLETEIWIVDQILKEVPHRHIVFTIPKLLRRPFFHHREALNDLSRIAWDCVKTFMRDALGEGTPAAVQAIECAGEYLEPNPHIHVIAADGLFADDGTFRPLRRLDEGAHHYLLSLWKKAVATFALKHEFISPDMMGKVIGWQHTGFSVFAERRVDFKRSNEASVEEMRHLARYIAKPPFALEKIVWKEGSDTVIYKGVRITKWHPQNFETFNVLDFIAAIAGQIPKNRQKLVNYYGAYSNKTRGCVRKRSGGAKAGAGSKATESQANFRQTWAMLIQRVWEVDPLECPRCHKPMKIVAIVDDAGLVEATLRRMGKWQELAPRGPPIDLHPPPVQETEREKWWDDMPGKD